MTLETALKRFFPWFRFRRGPQTFALVGKSGTGKSFQAKSVAQKFRIDLIIDDGLLIKGKKIIAGRSAKREKGILGAIRTALFANPDQVADVKKALSMEKFNRILIIGTSIKMIERIRRTLDLPPTHRIISIEDVSKREEIAKALTIRSEQGKHIIPVPAVEIKRNYPHIFFESIKVLLKRSARQGKNSESVVEKTVVRPEYGKSASASSEKTVSKSI
jgi:ABC-type dipeptide/oligopeptide/nickel transport system ATPase component